MTLPPSVNQLAEALAELPSLGPRQALRLAIYLARGASAAKALREALLGIGEIKSCAHCFLIHENTGPHCAICADGTRNPKVVMIVEKETDLLSVESTKKFTGNYLILGAIPRTGILDDWQKRRLDAFRTRVAADLGGTLDEIIVGTNPSAQGDFSALELGRELAGFAKRITRLGRGLPVGGEIEFADQETLGSALDGRI